MAWELKKVEEQRKLLIDAYITGKASMTELCEHFGVSRKTAYKWYNRFLESGYEGLKDQSKSPCQPHTDFSETIINLAIEYKLKHIRWGPRKILHNLSCEYPKIHWPSATRLYEILKENNLVIPKRIRKRVSGTHPLGELNSSNNVWMADFKGWFLTQNGQKCEPLTITDGYSRYLIKCTHLTKKTATDVWQIYKEAFEEHGLPDRMRTDNGPPFGSVGVGRLTSLSVNLIKAGVTPEWINPGHPEENGRHERFHLTLKQEVASPSAANIQEQIIRMAAFQEEYNFERPHEALKMQTPGNVYKNSHRKWDGILRDPEYDASSMLVRKIGQNGCLYIKQKAYYIGETLTGEYVGLQEEEGGFNVFYGQVYLGKIKLGQELVRPSLKPKNIVRRD